MAATTYRTSHNCSDQLTTNVPVAGFTSQLKRWWNAYLTKEDKQNIFQSVRLDPLGNPILKDGHSIPDLANTFDLYHNQKLHRRSKYF